MAAPTSIPAGLAGHRHRAASVAMWTSIVLCGVLLAVLLVLGWGARAWGVAGGLLAVSCIAVCLWGGVVAERADREVDRLVARLAETRRRQS